LIALIQFRLTHFTFRASHIQDLYKSRPITNIWCNSPSSSTTFTNCSVSYSFQKHVCTALNIQTYPIMPNSQTSACSSSTGGLLGDFTFISTGLTYKHQHALVLQVVYWVISLLSQQA